MTTRRRPARMVPALLLGLSLGAVACGNDSGNRADRPSSGPERTTVKVALFRYDPSPLEVNAGTTVTWRNDDAILHTVTAGVPAEPSGQFDEELPDKGTTASVTLDRPGAFRYFCTRHPEAMRGEVVVT